MKITVWIATRESRTWTTAAEVLTLAAVLLAPWSIFLRVVLGLPVLAHLGWNALTSIPAGAIPGRPEGGEVRRNHHLRARVSTFLSEVQRMEKYVRDARDAGVPTSEVKKKLRWADSRLQATTAEVVKALGSTNV